MAPRQRTFELVPNAPQGLGQQQHQPLQQLHQQQNGQAVHSKPPMTTKQAKKLHRQASTGPKLSKAEQRRIELMEQDRIRKEFDRERAQARARTARERKKAKEDKEKEERRRKGLPCVDPHASQDMISRYISWGPAKKQHSAAATPHLEKLREQDTDTDTANDTVTDADADAESVDDDERQARNKGDREPLDDSADERKAKRPRLGQADNKTPAGKERLARSLSVGPVAKIAQDLGVGSYSRASSVDTDDPINETLLENQIIADMMLASSRKLAQQDPAADLSPPPALDLFAPSVLPKEASRPHEPQRPESSIRKHFPFKISASSRLGVGPLKKPTSPYLSVKGQRRADKLPPNKLQPACQGFKSPAARPGQPSEGPQFLPKHLQTPRQAQLASNVWTEEQSNPQFAQPSSTQALLLLHADEFTASPSQEAEELSDFPQAGEKPRPALRSVGAAGNPSITAEASTQQHPVTPSLTRLEPTLLPRCASAAAADVSALDFLICTQELCMSSQDIRDIDTPSKFPEPANVRSLSHTDIEKDALPNPQGTCAPEPTDPARSVWSIAEESNNLATVVAPDRCTGHSAQGLLNIHGASPRVNAAAECRQFQLTAAKSPGAHPYERPKTSSSAVQAPASHETKGGCTPRSQHRQRFALKHPQITTQSNVSNSTTRLRVHNTTPQQSPAKRRMFGSSGPGAEVLVAMERSYQQLRREERAREDSVREEQRKLLVRTTATAKSTADEEQMNLEQLMELAENFPEDDMSSFTKENSEAAPSVPIHADTTAEGAETLGALIGLGDGQNRPMGSQETDYGDFGFDEEREVLGILERDLSWLDDDLDECR